MEFNNKMSILVLSCDKYKDAWKGFFDTKEKYWSDCNFMTYLVNNNLPYKRDGVITLNEGDADWSTRFRNAVIKAQTPYIAVFLEDSFICDDIDNKLINDLVDFVEKNKVSWLNLEDAFDYRKKKLIEKNYFANHIFVIPKHLKYAVDTCAAIWDKEYLLETIGPEDYGAWRFEIDLCKKAASEEGIPGLLLCDDRQPFNVTKYPIIIQGKYYRPGLKYFKEKGYTIETGDRAIMSRWDCFLYRFKQKMAGAKHGRRFLKWVGHHILGLEFMSEG